MMSNKDITVTRHYNGNIELSTMNKGYRVKRVYIGYDEDFDSIKKMIAYLKKLFKEDLYG
jgi:hypothetical protein